MVDKKVLLCPREYGVIVGMWVDGCIVFGTWCFFGKIFVKFLVYRQNLSLFIEDGVFNF